MLIDGTRLANKITEELKEEIALEKKKGISCSLGVIMVEGNPSSEVYVRMKMEKGKQIGIDFVLASFKNPTVVELIQKIKDWNEDEKITGIIVQMPLPKDFDPYKIINFIDPRKDVDGLTDINQNCLEEGRDCLTPATPLGVLEILKEYKINVKDKNVTVLGRSRLVGKPIAILLKRMGAKVSVCHSQTLNTAELSKQADILISAVGKPGLIQADMVKAGAVVIDIGITATSEGFKGDVDFEKVRKKTSFITPVPGGVGPMTVVSLMKNVLKASKKLIT